MQIEFNMPCFVQSLHDFCHHHNFYSQLKNPIIRSEIMIYVEDLVVNHSLAPAPIFRPTFFQSLLDPRVFFLNLRAAVMGCRCCRCMALRVTPSRANRDETIAAEDHGHSKCCNRGIQGLET